MRKLLVGLLAVAFVGLAARADDEKYTSKGGKYSIAFPADAKVKTETKDANGLKMYFATVEVKDKAYAVMYMDLPDAVKDVPAKDLLDAAEKGAVKESKGKLLDSADITFGKKKYPGREILVDKDGNKVRSRIILVETRAYVTVVGGPKDFADGKAATAFLDSFELTK